MKFKLLGTGTSQGVPVIGCTCEVCSSMDTRDARLRSSLMVCHEGINIVIDVGPDFRQQMLTNRVDSLEAIFITHEHNDHVIGLDDVRPFNYKQKRALNIYAESSVHEQLRERFSYAFGESPYPGAPQLTQIVISPEETVQVAKIAVRAFRVMHGALPILGFDFGKAAYITDAKTIDESVVDQLKGKELIVINALHQNLHSTHLNLEESLAMIDKLEPKRALLTHISHHMGLAAEVEKILPSHVSLAYDGIEMVL